MHLAKNRIALLLADAKMSCSSRWCVVDIPGLQKLLSKFMVKIPGMVTSGLKSNLVHLIPAYRSKQDFNMAEAQ